MESVHGSTPPCSAINAGVRTVDRNYAKLLFLVHVIPEGYSGIVGIYYIAL